MIVLFSLSLLKTPYSYLFFILLPSCSYCYFFPFSPVPVCIKVHNTSTAAESNLASSGFCDSPSILEVCCNSTWGWRWDFSTSGRALTSCVIDTVSARDGEGKDLSDVFSCIQSDKYAHRVCGFYAEVETFNAHRPGMRYTPWS